MRSLYLKQAVKISVGGLLLSLSANAMQNQQNAQQMIQQTKPVVQIEIPTSPPCVSSCSVKSHKTTYSLGHNGTVEKNVVITTVCQVEKSWLGDKTHGETFPVGKSTPCTPTAQQQIAQQTCTPVSATPLSLRIDQDVNGTTQGTLIKKDYLTYNFNRAHGGIQVVDHDCSNETVTEQEFFGEFVDQSDIATADAISALEDYLRIHGPLVIRDGESGKKSIAQASQTSQTSQVNQASQIASNSTVVERPVRRHNK